MQQAIRQETHTSVCVGIITTQAADLRTMLRTRDEVFWCPCGLGLAWGAVEVGVLRGVFAPCSAVAVAAFGDAIVLIHVRLSLSASLRFLRPRSQIYKNPFRMACGACGALSP